MKAFNFPVNPKLHQEFIVGSAIYIWDGVKWGPKGVPVSHIQVKPFIKQEGAALK